MNLTKLKIDGNEGTIAVPLSAIYTIAIVLIFKLQDLGIIFAQYLASYIGFMMILALYVTKTKLRKKK